MHQAYFPAGRCKNIKMRPGFPASFERVEKGSRRGDPWSPVDFAQQNPSPQGEKKVISLWEIRKTSFFGGRPRVAPTVFTKNQVLRQSEMRPGFPASFFFSENKNVLVDLVRYKGKRVSVGIRLGGFVCPDFHSLIVQIGDFVKRSSHFIMQHIQ